MAESTEFTVGKKLNEVFEEAYNLFYSFKTCYDPTNSPEFQEKVKKCIGLFEDSTRLVSLIGMFSTNESYDEIATEDLKYLLLPFFLAQLTLKICNTNRKEIVEVAEVYFNDFMSRCEQYQLCEKRQQVAKVEGRPQTEMEMLSRQAVDRNAKLELYRQKKELEDQIKTLKIAMEREDVDEDIKREFFTKLLNSCIMDTRDELSSLASEKEILAYMDVMKKNNPEALKPEKHHKPTPLKPIIITKDEFQKTVYGMGYPSMPTMTVQDFYDQQVAAGIFPDPNKPRIQTQVIQGSDADLEQQELEDIEKEVRVEQDDEEELRRARDKDEFKDEHRRGYGNRYNRS